MSATVGISLPDRAAPPSPVAWRRTRAALRRARRAAARLPALLASAWTRVPFERLFWIGFVILLLLFVFLLVVQPTGAGRGGR